jgi:transcriptional regulator with XRE-family HTH domain
VALTIGIMTMTAEPGPFARELRRWRGLRRWSQLDLAIRTGTTQRYLSFLEQGRSQPGRTVVMRLAESLGLSLRERNALLMSAGYAPAFDESGWDAPVNVLRLALHPDGPARRIANLPEWGRHVTEALRTRTRISPDPELDALVAELESYLPPVEPGPGYLGFAVPLKLRTADGELSLITTLMSVATATDISLAELHLEAFLPADRATADILRARAERGSPVAGSDRWR